MKDYFPYQLPSIQSSAKSAADKAIRITISSFGTKQCCLQKFLTVIDQRREDLRLMLKKQAQEEQRTFEAHAEALQEYHRQMEKRHEVDREELNQLTRR